MPSLLELTALAAALGFIAILLRGILLLQQDRCRCVECGASEKSRNVWSPDESGRWQWRRMCAPCVASFVANQRAAAKSDAAIRAEVRKLDAQQRRLADLRRKLG